MAGPAVSGRDGEIAAFLERAGWGDAQRRPLAGDASFRRYDRLEGPRGRAVLMDAPPPHEDIRPFVAIALLAIRDDIPASAWARRRSLPRTPKPACCCSRTWAMRSTNVSSRMAPTRGGSISLPSTP